MDLNLDKSGNAAGISPVHEFDEPVMQNETPLLAALLHLKADRRLSFHMPGHRNGLSWPKWLAENLVDLDTTELPVSFDMLRPDGAMLESMKIAAGFFGSGWTRFLTTGSTTALIVLLSGCLGRRGRLLVSRNCHQSIMHAAALLDLEIGWIRPTGKRANSLEFLPQVTAEDVKMALDIFGKCDAVLITSPDYYGSCADLSAIADIVHLADSVLLVDEAHGTHFCAAPDLLPLSAMAAGADACVQSAHKTLPALTSASMIHISQQSIDSARLDPEKFENMLRVFHTSSPSYVIAASIDFARWYLQRSGRDSITSLIKKIEWFAGQLPDGFITSADFGSAGMYCRDSVRLVIGFNDDRISVKSLAQALQNNKIDIEMSDLRRLVLIPSLDQPQEDFNDLAKICRRWIEGDLTTESPVMLSHQETEQLIELDNELSFWLSDPAELSVLPGEVMFGRPSVIKLDWKAAVGRMAAEAIVPYPPGIPLVWPGERLSLQKLAFICSLSENDLSLTGFSEGSLSVLA